MSKINIFMALILLACFSAVVAEDKVPDKFKIALGGYSVIRYDSAMSLTERNLGAGISISPEDTLGIDNKQTVLRLDGYYRFSKEHALSYSWYSISSKGIKTIDKEFEWLDSNGDLITVPIGAEVDTDFEYDIYKIGYLWSFYHTNKVELVAGAGLHMTRISVALRSDTTSSGVDTKDVTTSVPLPVLSFGLSYKVTPKLHWFIRAEAFALAFEDWDGLYTDSNLGLEYRIFKNVGLGVGVGSNSLNVTENTNDYKFSFDNRITGVTLDLAFYF
jgi:hypothetical protein